MEIQNASTTSSKSNQLRNVNTVGWESWNVTTQPWEINNRKSDVIAFVVKIWIQNLFLAISPRFRLTYYPLVV